MQRSVAMRFVGLPALLLLGLWPAAHAAESSYSYLELVADTSRTDNTGPGAVDHADGTFLGIAGSWQLHESWYVKAGYTVEDKSFTNDVAGTRLSLESEQAIYTAGVGHYWRLQEGTDFHVEALGIVSEVEHDVPNVVPMRFGPPSVSTRQSMIEGKGLAAGFGVRHWMNDALEIDARFGRSVLNCEIASSGAKCPTTHETTLGIAARYHVADNFSTGVLFSYSKNTDPNFDNIVKLGLSLRYTFDFDRADR